MVATADNPSMPYCLLLNYSRRPLFTILIYVADLYLPFNKNICRRPVFVAYLRIVASGCLPSRCISTNT